MTPLSPEKSKRDAVPRTLTLSTGAVAVLREPTGYDLERAATAAGPGANNVALMMALIAQVAIIDGRPIAFEDVRALKMTDVTLLLGAVTGEDAEGNAVSPSPLSTSSS